MKELKNIIGLIESGHKEGFEWLFEQYGQKFFGIAVDKWSFSEDEAYDMIYKTFNALNKNVGRYEFESFKHLENFLFKVFLNNLRELYRSKTNFEEKIFIRSFSDLEEDIVENFSQPESEEEAFTINELLEQLLVALDKLSVEEKDLLLLRAQNFSYQEITNYLGIKSDNLKVKHLRAKNKLFKIITDNSEKSNI